jgi:hypothetical protein
VIVLFSATADITGLGEGSGFGLWQVGGVFIGVLVIIASWLLGRKREIGKNHNM